MSLILDALNRSRNEQGEVPNLETVHAASAAGGRPTRLLWVALVAAVVIIAWLLLDRAGDADPPAVDVPREPAAEQGPAVSSPAEPVQAERQAPAAPTVRKPTPVDPPTTSQRRELVPPAPDPEVAALYTAPDTSPAAPAPDVAEEAAAPVTPQREEEVPAADGALGEPARAGTQEQSIDIEQMILQAEDELEDARLEEHPAPFLASLSQSAKDGVPTILYQRHEYSGRPGESRVVLNGETLAVGGRTRDVRVEQILPDSVVLSYQGTSFRLRALNSWVNL